MPWFYDTLSGADAFFVRDEDLQAFRADSSSAMSIEVEPPRCGDCGLPQIDTDSGVCCPNGHGGAASVWLEAPEGQRYKPKVRGPEPRPRHRVVVAQRQNGETLILEPSQVQSCWRAAILPPGMDPAAAPPGAGRLISEGSAEDCLKWASGEILIWATPEAEQDLASALEAWRILLAQAHRLLDTQCKG